MRKGENMDFFVRKAVYISLVFVLGAMFTASSPTVKALAAGPMPAWNAKSSPPPSGNNLTLYCPKAYLGVRSDLLPTHWEVFKGSKPLQLKSSQVQGQDMVCVYGEAGQAAVGSVRRLIPGGYKCISDGVGTFKCEKTGR